MNIFLLFSILFLTSTNLTFAQCGLHRQQNQAAENIRQRSSVIIQQEIKNFKKLATISKKHAKNFAISHYEGKVKDAKLVKEEDTLVWKIEVKGNQGQKELFIDPANGEFLGYGLTK
jgi:uncharacterized membrane protein YkoI